MDIKELEFIRDFSDVIDHLYNDMLNVAVALENGAEDEEIKEVPIIASNAAWSIVHHLETAEKLFDAFKEKIDQKYHHVWRTHNPQMAETHEEMQAQLDQIK